jgi:hypothetical protein
MILPTYEKKSQSFKITRYNLHEMAEQEEDMKSKKILLTARGKQGTYC